MNVTFQNIKTKLNIYDLQNDEFIPTGKKLVKFVKFLKWKKFVKFELSIYDFDGSEVRVM